jgi:glycerol-3-phosphate cytidylyltransferase
MSLYPKKTPRWVYTYGVYDLFHVGHLNSLKQAKKQGDILVVGVFTTHTAMKFKRRPIIPFEQRMEIIRNIRFVDEVRPLNNLIPDKWDYVGCNVIAKGPGAKFEDLEFDNIEKVLLEYTEGVSTSEIIEKIKNL